MMGGCPSFPGWSWNDASPRMQEAGQRPGEGETEGASVEVGGWQPARGMGGDGSSPEPWASVATWLVAFAEACHVADSALGLLPP